MSLVVAWPSASRAPNTLPSMVRSVAARRIGMARAPAAPGSTRGWVPRCWAGLASSRVLTMRHAGVWLGIPSIVKYRSGCVMR